MNLLRARCELDRRELGAEVGRCRERWHGRVEGVRRAVPWMVLAAPLVGVALVRALRGRRGWVAALAVAKVAMQFRGLLPLASGWLRPRGRGEGAGR
ncbi:MAG: hypothetical protein KF833_03095 [Verrucomicrobiae bacterium]|nr:hypothetical protein [Verrucomicrobiae bacterium]